MVPRFLVSNEVIRHSSTSGEDSSMNGSMKPAFFGEPGEAILVSGKRVFAEAMLENSATRSLRPVRNFVVSATVQVLFLAILLILPLYFTEAIDVHRFNQTLLVTPPAAPAPPPPPASTRSVAPRRRALSLGAKLVVPRIIPNHVTVHAEEPSGADLTAVIAPGDGVPGGIPGGQPGGVIGGTPSGPTPPPPPPIDSAPKTPIRVGGKVKAPRLLFGPDPVYPVLARQAKVSGAVVIDAVIDAQGNVVGMRTVSGPAILALAAMETLRQWKYEPTILGGEAIPVELLVTITFERKGPQA